MSATKPEPGLWSGPIIPFEIDANFDNPARILTAIRDHWEEQTNVRFVRRNGQSNFILFRNGQRCSSPTGQQGGMQSVTCAPDGSVSSIVHEIGHASGLIHEHQRSDRDTFVQVQKANIEPGREHNFGRIANSINSTEYDLRSIMHYGVNFFSVDGSPTLVPSDPSAVLNGSATFTPLDLQGLNEIYPNVGIVRRSDSGFEAAGEVSEIAVTSDSARSVVVTAVRTKEGTLRLILWRINASGGITRIKDSGTQAGKATSIAIAQSGQLFVTACRTSSGRLKLIKWSTTSDPNEITREGESANNAAGNASLIRILALTRDLFVTACRDSGANLVLITWRLSVASFQRLADSHGQAGTVSEISLARVRQLGSDHQVATTVRTGEGRVKVIVWNVADDGSISRLGDSRENIGAGRLIESAIHPASGMLVVSCKTSGGKLKVIALSVSDSGKDIQRRGDSGDQAGGIRSNSLMARPTGVLSAVRAENGNLKLIGWGIDADGQVTRLGDSAPDQAGEIGLVRGNNTRQPDAPVLTCVQTEEGDLKLITWDDQPAHGELS